MLPPRNLFVTCFLVILLFWCLASVRHFLRQVSSSSSAEVSWVEGYKNHQRNELWYPPFNRICKILFQGNNKLETQKCSEKIGKIIKDNNFIVLGPSIAPIEKIKGLWRFHLLIKISHEKPFKFQNFIKNKMGVDILQKKHN